MEESCPTINNQQPAMTISVVVALLFLITMMNSNESTRSLRVSCLKGKVDSANRSIHDFSSR